MILAPVYLLLSTSLATAPVSVDTAGLGKSSWFWNTARKEDASPRDGTGQVAGIQAHHGAWKHSHRLQQQMGAIWKVGARAWVTIGWWEQIQKEGGCDGASFLPFHPLFFSFFFFADVLESAEALAGIQASTFVIKNTSASLDELKPFHKQTANRTVTYLREEGVEDDVNVVLC